MTRMMDWGAHPPRVWVIAPSRSRTFWTGIGANCFGGAPLRLRSRLRQDFGVAGRTGSSSSRAEGRLGSLYLPWLEQNPKASLDKVMIAR
jgi:hypothetical protein